MKRNKRNRYSAVFKVMEPMAALRDEATISELSSRFGVHPNLVIKWKRQAADVLVENHAGQGGPRPSLSLDAAPRRLHDQRGLLEADFAPPIAAGSNGSCITGMGIPCAPSVMANPIPFSQNITSFTGAF